MILNTYKMREQIPQTAPQLFKDAQRRFQLLPPPKTFVTCKYWLEVLKLFSKLSTRTFLDAFWGEFKIFGKFISRVLIFAPLSPQIFNAHF